MPRFVRSSLLLVVFLVFAGPAWAGLLTLTVVSGLTTPDGETIILDPLLQESLSGSTLTQLGTPALFDPVLQGALGITVRITNTSDQEIAFPDLLPGISVLTSVSGISGYSARTNVAAGGSARSGGDGVEGAVSRTVLDLTVPLDVASSPVVGSHGGGGGAGTGVADCWISVTGASGYELAEFLAGLRLAPGASVDIPDFIRIAAFGRAVEGARIAFGFDLPTFSSGGVSVTTTAWTGAFTGPAPPGGPGGDPVAVPEPGTTAAWLAGLAGLCAGGRFRRMERDRVEERAREVR
ncbi:MAG TPA: PEP-CTERM sorting domain-containing protein [Acidobacteriota bacterium]|nr:PEP-CTERM sorting domain-containing protein [Acidobacteriota bacterium]